MCKFLNKRVELASKKHKREKKRKKEKVWPTESIKYNHRKSSGTIVMYNTFKRLKLIDLSPEILWQRRI